MPFYLGRFFSVLLLSFVSGIHSGIIRFAFGMWLKDLGMHIIYLGLFNLIFLPFSLKIFWIPWLEMPTRLFRKFGNRKGFLMLFEAVIIALVFSLSVFTPTEYNLFCIISYGILFASCVATKEALAIAYQMETIKSQNWGSSEGKVASAYHIGFWIGKPI